MKSRGRTIFLSLMLIASLSISLIPIYPSTNSYAETTTPQSDFVVPVTPLTDAEVPADYIKITTKEELNNIRNDLDGKYILMNDIVFTEADFAEGGYFYNDGKGWEPVGSYPSVFNGIFDGNGYVIDGVVQHSINQSTSTEAIGIFGYVTGGSISNLGVVNSQIVARNTGMYENSGIIVGGIVGVLNRGVIQNCFFSGNINGESETANGNTRVGGIVGSSSVGTELIIKCLNSGYLVSDKYVGGITGSGGDIRECCNFGNLTANGSSTNYAGGISAGGATISTCFNAGDIIVGGGWIGLDNTTYYQPCIVGGIAGESILVRSSYNTGEISAISNKEVCLGGILGTEGVGNDTYIADCFNSGTLNNSMSKYAKLGGIIGSGEGNIVEIRNCYNVGQLKSVATETAIDGISGGPAVPTNCYYLSNNQQGVTSHYGSKLSDLQMRSPGSFVGFDFVSVWKIDHNVQYPYPSLVKNTYKGVPYFNVTFASNNGFAYNTFGAPAGGTVPTPDQPTKTGYSLDGWFRETGLVNSWNFDNDIMPASDLTLYAKWVPNTYTIKYNANGGTGIMADQPMSYDTSKALNSNAFKRVGYTFAGWSKTATGSVAFSNSASVKNLSSSNGGTVNLYAKWTPISYAIKFYANGGSGTMSPIYLEYDNPQVLPGSTFKKIGYSFLGWSKSSTGSVVYKNKATVKNLTTTNNATLGLYAKWGAPILSATSYNYTSIKVAWAYAGGATSYKVYRATSATGTYSLVYNGSSTARSWIDTGQTTGKTYYYKVYPVASGKTYTFSTYKSAKAVPSAPSISVSKSTSTSIKVTWTGVSGATKYQIYRATSATGTYSLVYTASSSARYWVNPGLTPGKTYYYKVRAYHLEGTTEVYGVSSAAKYLKI